MSDFYMPRVDRKLAERYYDLTGDNDIGIPTLPHEEATTEFYEKAIRWCLDNKKPMEEFWKMNFPDEFEEYHRQVANGYLL